MDKYHIYEEIGKGDFSQVFKGREKKKIEYVAIKRVEKSMMSKVVNEVQVMHKLESPHILKFHDWYETRNNLWLILEYCTGADLESLLKQDGHLPEASVRMFGLDMIAALKYMHNLGILHCDLRPKNFLVDEYGILKISDFKSARKVPKIPTGDTLKSSKDISESKGTAAYMSPELFTLDGVHSYCSDFWAVGCVMYELRRGVPPFGWEYSSSSGSVTVKELTERINTAEPVGNPIVFADHTDNSNNNGNNNSNYNNNHGNNNNNNNNNRDRESKADRSYSTKNNSNSNSHNATPSVSAEFADLLRWLLEKSPAGRCVWSELVAHPFWGEHADRNEAPNNLPAQPAFDALVKKLVGSRALALQAETMATFGLVLNESSGEFESVNPSDSNSISDDVYSEQYPGGDFKAQGDRGMDRGSDYETSLRSEGKSGREDRLGDKESDIDSKVWVSSSKAKESPMPSRTGRRDEDSSLRQLEEAPTPARVPLPSTYYNKVKPVIATPSKVPVVPLNPGTNPSEAKTPLAKHGEKNYGYSSSGGGGSSSSGSGAPVYVPPTPPTSQALLQTPLVHAGADSRGNNNSSSNSSSSKGNNAYQTPLSPGPAPANTHKLQRGYSEFVDEQENANQNSAVKVGVADSGLERDNRRAALGGTGVGTETPVGRYRVPDAVWAKGLQLGVQELLTHASDSQVRPIVGNKSIEAIEKAAFKPAALPFPALSTEDIGRLTQAELEGHLTQVYKALHRHVVLSSPPTATAIASSATMSALNDRLNVLGYLCSNAHSAEVANIVLNTHFLSLLLRLLRGPAGAVIPSPGVQMSSSAYWTLLGACRGLAATVLATTLRYTTFVQPPTSKNKDDHILPTLIGILKDSPKVEVKLRRRCVAALGELVFYITAQEEESPGGGAGVLDSRWVLPLGAIVVLTKCLKDDSDEAVRHYAAKTFENVLAQGGLEYRKRLVSKEAALRLLSLAQSSTRNESIQSSCGMALAHMVHLVATTNPVIGLTLGGTLTLADVTALSVEAGSAGTSANSTRRFAGSGPLARVNATKGGTMRGESSGPGSGRDSPSKGLSGSQNCVISPASLGATMNMEDAVEEVAPPGAWALFVSQVLEQEGAISGILDALKDGAPKLQQAYLNIVNMMFLPSIGSNAEEVDVERALGGIRAVLIQSDTALPSILRLIEQGGSSAVRAKALISAQLLCRHSPVLLKVLGERRLPNTLVRLIEPFVSRTAEHQASSNFRDQKGVKPLEPLSYVEKAALSMVLFLRDACVGGATELRHQLGLLSPGGVGSQGGSPLRQDGRNDAPFSVAKGQNTPTVLQGTPSSARSQNPAYPGSTPLNGRNLDGEFESGRRGEDRQESDQRSRGGPDGARGMLSVARLSASAVTLRASVSMATQPSLRRLMIAGGDDDSEGARGDVEFVYVLSDILSLLPVARAAAASHSNRHSSSVLDAVTEAEQAALVALEIIAQIDSIVDFGAKSDGARAFLDAVARKLLPAVSNLSEHVDGDVRVVVSASLRRMLPPVLKDLDREGVNLCVSAFLVHLPSLMADHPPIPQYTLRLLCEAIKASPHAVHVITSRLLSGGHLKIFVTALAGSRNNRSDRDRHTDEEAVSDCDPQLPILLRILYERGQQEEQEQAVNLKKNLFPSQPDSPAKKRSCTKITYAMLELGIAQSLCVAIQAAVGDAGAGIGGVGMEVVGSLVELLHRVLLFVIMALSQSAHTSQAGANGGSERNQVQSPGEADQLRRYVMPLRDLCPSLFSVLSGAVTQHPNGIQFEQEESASHNSDLSATKQLHDSTARCMGILFDIFPDVVISYLVSSQTGQGHGDGGEDSPREILARLLTSNQVDLKIRIRLLKIVMGVCKIAPAMGPAMVQRAKDLLLAPPLHKALIACINPPPGGSYSSGNAPNTDRPSPTDVALYVDLARDLLATAIQM